MNLMHSATNLINTTDVFSKISPEDTFNDIDIYRFSPMINRSTKEIEFMELDKYDCTDIDVVIPIMKNYKLTPMEINYVTHDFMKHKLQMSTIIRDRMYQSGDSDDLDRHYVLPSVNVQHLSLTELNKAVIRRFWRHLIRYQELSSNFMTVYKTYMNWVEVSIHQDLDIPFIYKYANDLVKTIIMQRFTLPVDFIAEYMNVKSIFIALLIHNHQSHAEHLVPKKIRDSITSNNFHLPPVALPQLK